MSDIDDLIARLGDCAHHARQCIPPRAETIDESAAALRAQRDEIAVLRKWEDIAEASTTTARIAVERAERAEAERELAQAEASSATEAATVLLTALGWKSGGLDAAAIQIVQERDALREVVEAAKALRTDGDFDGLWGTLAAFDAALAKLEQEQGR